MKIFLIGYMGAGKTTLGRPLAEKLQVPFIDLDAAIEAREGRTIRQLFIEVGEAVFREKERDCLQSGDFPEQFVMATGGGAPCFFDNMDWMNRQGVTIYLRADPLTIASRLEDQREERPLLRSLSKEELPEFVRNRLRERDIYYMKAELVLEKPGGLTLDDLLEALSGYVR